MNLASSTSSTGGREAPSRWRWVEAVEVAAAIRMRPLLGQSFCRSDSIGPVRLPRRSLKAEAAQGALELRYTCSDALEVLT
jgi:hypothetical protein